MSESPFTIPIDIIRRVAELVDDEQTVWRLRAVSRTVKDEAETVLRLFLAEKRVLGGEPFIENIFTPVDEIHIEDNKLGLDRSTKLEARSDLIEAHVQVFKPSANLIRSLVLEVRYDAQPAIWWITRVAEQLEKLELHVYDGLWRQVEKYGNRDVTGLTDRGVILPAEVLARVFYAPLPPHVTRMPSLRTLILCTTARPLDHLASIADWLLTSWVGDAFTARLTLIFQMLLTASALRCVPRGVQAITAVG